MDNLTERGVKVLYSDAHCSSTIKCCFELSKGIGQLTDSSIVYYTQFEEKLVLSHDIIIFQRIGANATVITQNYIDKFFALIDQYKDRKIFIYLIDDLLMEDQEGLAGATKTVVISSKRAAYVFAIENNENGLLVDDTVESWIEAIKRLYDDENLRNSIINNAYLDVMNQYTLRHAAQNALKIFEDIQSV